MRSDRDRRDRGDQETTLTTIRRGLVRFPSLALVATDRDGRETAAPLGVAPVVVGTGADADLVVHDPAVSRRHCIVTVTVQGVLVRDLQSKNGTSVGGVEVNEAYLASTGYARVGGVTLRIRVVGAPMDVPVWQDANFGAALGGSIPMRLLFRILHEAAQTSENVLLFGESGTGKGLLAAAIHEASPRRDGPLSVLDVAAVAPERFEAELFGVASTVDHPGLLDEASGGTLVIDEVGELPLELQLKLLPLLEERRFRPVGSHAWRASDARVVATTQYDLRALVAAGRFRPDLAHRLAAIEARVPPLRERKDDIELLVERFLASETPPRTLLDLPIGAMGMLAGHDWPGNVRELKNTMSRMVLFPHAAAGSLELARLSGDAPQTVEAIFALPWREAREQMMERFEANYLSSKLKEHGGNVSRTADSMGVSRQLVHRLMVRHDIRGR